jgi:hypothetical protein
MIDVDADIEESWLRPKEGFRDNNDDGDEDNVNFGKSSIDSLSQPSEMNLLFQFLVELLTKHFKMIQTGDSKMPHLWLSLKLVNTLTKSQRSDKWFQSLLHI